MEKVLAEAPPPFAVKLLLDVNVLVALLDPDHQHHDKVHAWYDTSRDHTFCLSCSITEIGVIRVLMQTGAVGSVREAQDALAALKKNLGKRMTFVADDVGGATMPTFVKTHRQTTDGHLYVLARRHGARLATFDRGIPEAVVIS